MFNTLSGLAVSEDQLKEVAEHSGVLNVKDDFLEHAFRLECERWVPNTNDNKSTELQASLLIFETKLCPSQLITQLSSLRSLVHFSWHSYCATAAYWTSRIFKIEINRNKLDFQGNSVINISERISYPMLSDCPYNQSTK